MSSKTAALIITALLLAAPAAHAGQKNVYSDVHVDANGRWAQGSMGAARNSADGNQLVACDTSAWSNTASPGILCYARNAAGRFAYCSSTAPAFVEAVKTLSSDSMVTFSWNASGICTYLAINTNSGLEPKR